MADAIIIESFVWFVDGESRIGSASEDIRSGQAVQIVESQVALSRTRFDGMALTTARIGEPVAYACPGSKVCPGCELRPGGYCLSEYTPGAIAPDTDGGTVIVGNSPDGIYLELGDSRVDSASG